MWESIRRVFVNSIQNQLKPTFQGFPIASDSHTPINKTIKPDFGSRRCGVYHWGYTPMTTPEIEAAKVVSQINPGIPKAGTIPYFNRWTNNNGL